MSLATKRKLQSPAPCRARLGENVADEQVAIAAAMQLLQGLRTGHTPQFTYTLRRRDCSTVANVLGSRLLGGTATAPSGEIIKSHTSDAATSQDLQSASNASLASHHVCLSASRRLKQPAQAVGAGQKCAQTDDWQNRDRGPRNSVGRCPGATRIAKDIRIPNCASQSTCGRGMYTTSAGWRTRG